MQYYLLHILLNVQQKKKILASHMIDNTKKRVYLSQNF